MFIKLPNGNIVGITGGSVERHVTWWGYGRSCILFNGRIKLFVPDEQISRLLGIIYKAVTGDGTESALGHGEVQGIEIIVDETGKFNCTASVLYDI